MAAPIGSTDSSLRLQGSPDDTPKTISKKAAGAAAQGVSGESPSGAGSTPPASPVASQSTTVSLAPAPSAYQDAEAVTAAQVRLVAAANVGATANDSLDIAMTPLAALRALFKAALEANEQQQDDALADRKRGLEIARSKQLAAADENMTDAHNIDSNRWKPLAMSCASAAASVGAAAIHTSGDEPHWQTFGIKTEALLDGSVKGLDGWAGYTESGVKADSKVSDATVALYNADNDQAKGKVSDANDLGQRLRQQFQQIADAMKEIRDSQAQSIRIA